MTRIPLERDVAFQFLILSAAFIALSFRPLLDPDIWFYLVQGREIVESGSLPANEFYIFPAAGEEATFSAIGFAVFYYLVHQFAGYPGMAAANAIVAGASIALMLLAARPGISEEVRWPVMILVGTLAYLLAEFRFVYRPETVLFLSLSIEYLLLEKWLSTGRAGLLFAVLPLIAVHSYVHTSAFLLVLVMLAYMGQFIIVQFAQRRPDARRGLLLIGAAVAMTGVIAVVNPNGIEQFLVIARSAMGRDSGLVEYIPALETEYRWHFLVAALLAVTALALAPRQRAVDWALLSIFGYVAFTHARNIGLFAVISIVPLVRGLNAKCTVSRVWTWVSVALFSVACIWTVSDGRWGYGIARKLEFVESVAKIKSVARSQENVMNFFHHGGFIAWQLGRGTKVATDGHFVRATQANVYHDQVMRADPGWERMLEAYDVRFILTPVTLPYSGNLIPLVRQLTARDDWIVAGIEPAGVFFARSEFGDRLPNLPKSEVWRQAMREAEEILKTYPTHAGAIEALAESKRRLARAP